MSCSALTRSAAVTLAVTRRTIQTLTHVSRVRLIVAMLSRPTLLDISTPRPEPSPTAMRAATVYATATANASPPVTRWISRRGSCRGSFLCARDGPTGARVARDIAEQVRLGGAACVGGSGRLLGLRRSHLDRQDVVPDRLADSPRRRQCVDVVAARRQLDHQVGVADNEDRSAVLA